MKQKPQGILLCEVGNFSDRIRPRGQRRLEELLTDVFKETGVAKRGFQFFWGSGDTMAAFKPGVQVHGMEPLEKMFRVDDWRTVDRFMLFGATEHGKHALLIYNQHQPSSKQRPFKPQQKLNFCRAVLEDAMREHKNDASIIGFGFGGDANCGMAEFNTAFRECRGFDRHYGGLMCMFGKGKKGGDLMIGCESHGASEFACLKNACDVEGRERQHDPMIVQWRFTSKATKPLVLLPARTFRSNASGAQEHAVEKNSLKTVKRC